MKLQIIAVNILMLLSCCQNNEVSQNNEMLIDIDISDIPSGQYVIILSDGKNQMIQKLLIQH